MRKYGLFLAVALLATPPLAFAYDQYVAAETLATAKTELADGYDAWTSGPYADWETANSTYDDAYSRWSDYSKGGAKPWETSIANGYILAFSNLSSNAYTPLNDAYTLLNGGNSKVASAQSFYDGEDWDDCVAFSNSSYYDYVSLAYPKISEAAGYTTDMVTVADQFTAWLDLNGIP